MNTTTSLDMKGILVLGAGQLGLAVLKHLQPRVEELGAEIHVLVSPTSMDKNGSLIDEQHKHLVAKGVRFEGIDLTTISDSELVAYFAKFKTIINCTGFFAGPGSQIRITSAVLDAKVQRYFPWQFGVDYDIVGKGSGQPVFDEQYEVRTILRQQQHTEWVIISTGMFTSFLFEPTFDVINLKERVINGLGSWDTKVTVTSPDDIGYLTTSILLESPKIINKVVFVAGDTISYGQLAKVVKEITGKNFDCNISTVDSLKQELRLNPEDQMLRYRTAFALGDGMWWDKEETYNAKKGIETQNVEQWLSEHSDSILSHL